MEQVLPEEALEVVVLVQVAREWDVWEVTNQAPDPVAIVYVHHAEQQLLMKEVYHAARLSVPNADTQCFDCK